MFLEGKKKYSNQWNKQTEKSDNQRNKTLWNWRKGSAVKKACYTSEMGQFGPLDACNPT